MHVIQRFIGESPHYWNGTGWTTDRRRARKYDGYEANAVHRRMTLDGVMATVRRIVKKRRK